MKAPLELGKLFPELSSITDADLRAGVEAVWQELWERSTFERIEEVPTSTEINYPHVRHNQAILRLALATADVFESVHDVRVDRDVLIAAALLQDVSKLVEYRREGDGHEFTQLGTDYPHAFWGAHTALLHGLPASVCTIILTHTPNSPTFPASLEGKILYYVDQLDVIAIYRDRWRKELFVTK